MLTAYETETAGSAACRRIGNSDADRPAIEHDSESFGLMLENHRSMLFRFLLHRTRDYETALDLTQECFLKAVRHRASFRGDCSLSTWLVSIALNLFYDSCRRARRRRAANQVEVDFELAMTVVDRDSPDPERQVIVKERLRVVGQTLSEAPRFQREVFECRFLKGMTFQQIASGTGKSTACVKATFYKTISAIRKMKVEAAHPASRGGSVPGGLLA